MFDFDLVIIVRSIRRRVFAYLINTFACAMCNIHKICILYMINGGAYATKVIATIQLKKMS